MHSAADVTEEWTLQMDAERLRSSPRESRLPRDALSIASASRPRAEQVWSSGAVTRRRKITGHAMFEK